MTEVHPDTHTGDVKDKKGGEGKKGGFFEKYKLWIFGGIGVLIVVLYFMMRSNSAAAGTTASAGTPQSVAVPSGSGDTSSNIDPATGAVYGSPADVAALGGSGSVAATPGSGSVPPPAGSTSTPASGSPSGTTTPQGNGPGGTYIPGYTPITFKMAQALAGKSGSSKLFYGTQHGVVQGKYANDPHVQYFVKSG